MKKKVWSILLTAAVLLSVVDLPLEAGAAGNPGGSGSGVQISVKQDNNEKTEQGTVRTAHISATNSGTEDSVLRVYLQEEDGTNPDTDVEVINLYDDEGDFTGAADIEEATLKETLKEALTLSDGSAAALDAEWKQTKDSSGTVTERFLEAALPAGASASFDMQLMYRTDEENYTKTTLVKAKAFVDDQDVTQASEDEDEDNEAEVVWEMVTDETESEAGGDSEKITDTTEVTSTSRSIESTASTLSAENYAESRAIQATANTSITSMYNVPVTYYDYLDDSELTSTWRNVMEYGYDRNNGWTPFWHWNQGLANYYRDNNLTVPTGLYFGNLYTNSLGSDPSGDGARRQAQVINQINMVRGIYSGYSYPANNSNNLSGGLNSSAYGLVYNQLDDNGNLQISDGVAAPWFSEEFLAGKASASEVVNSYGQVLQSRFPFRTVDEDGVSYYEFDSNNGTDNVRYENGTFSYYSGWTNAVDDGADDYWGSTDSDNGGYGFFPFNKPGDSNNRDIDYGFGAKFEIRFNLPKGGELTDSNGNKVPVTFEFTGDDDVWVFIDGQLVLDMGGAHKKANGEINFKDLTARVTTGGQTINSSASYNSVDLKDVLGVESNDELSPNQGHTMTIFYMERGMIESNLKIRFNMQPLEHELIVEKDVDVENINEGLKDTVENADEFNVALSADHSVAVDKTYQKNDGTTGDTEYGLKTDSNGSFTLKDGDQAVFKKQFDDDIGKKFTAQESTVSNGKSYLSYDTTWTAVDLENNDSVIGSGITTKAEFNYDKTAGDEFTPVRNKLTYVNTPQTGSLSVQKTAVDSEGNSYKDTETEFTFQIMLDMGISTEGHYEEIDFTDPDAIYFRNSLNWSNVYAHCYTGGNNNGGWPGQKMAAVETEPGVYKLDGIIGNYDYVIFNDGNGNQYPASGYAIQNYNYFEISGSSLKGGTYKEMGEPEWIPGQELGYEAYDLTYTVNGETRTASDGTFTLKAGETAVFNGIPVGTQFKIKEVSAEGYTLKEVTVGGTVQNADSDGYYSGAVKQKSNETKIVVTNEKAEASLNLKAHKTVDGGEGTVSSGEFRFIMSGMASKSLTDGTVTKDTTDYTSRITNDGSGNIMFETISFQEQGTYLYTIKEVPGSDNKYQYDQSEYEVKVVVKADGSEMTPAVTVTKVKGSDGQKLSSPENVENIETGIIFNNVTNTATMTVQKQLVKENGDPLEKSSWPDSDSNFVFTFRLEALNEKTNQYEACGNQTYYFNNEKKTTQSNGTFSLQPQENDSGLKAEFRDLVIGTKYRITEVMTGMTAYEFKNVTVNGIEAGVIQTGREYAAETSIQKDGNAVVFKNYPLSSITIIKQDENNSPLGGAEFKLEKKIDNEKWEQIGRSEVSDKDTGEVYFENLHAGEYRITEVKTAAGYVLLKEPIMITLPYEYSEGSIVNGAEVTSDGTAYNITFTVVNGQAFDLPQSGLRGIGPLTAAGMAIVVTAGAIFAVRNIKGQRAVSRRRRRSSN